MTNYQVVYTVDGKGYSTDQPWIDSETDNPALVRELYEEAVKYLEAHKSNYEVWVQSQEVSPWTRVDLDSLP